MPYKITTAGDDELTQMLESLGTAAHGVASVGLYEGAGVMADAVSRAVQGIATEPFHYAADGHQRKPSPEEKALLEAAPKGVAKFNKTGTEVNTSVGLSRAGYGMLGKKLKPIPQIANAINSGTSFMKKQPFFTKAVRQNKSAALTAFENGVNRKIEEMTK